MLTDYYYLLSAKTSSMLQKQITDYLYQNKELPKAYTTIDRDKLVELCENRVKAWKEANL